MNRSIIYPSAFQPCILPVGPVDDGYEIYQADLEAMMREPGYSEEWLQETLRRYVRPIINKFMCSRLVPGYDLAEALKPLKRDIEKLGNIYGVPRAPIDFRITAVDCMNLSHAAWILDTSMIVLIRTAFALRCQQFKPTTRTSTRTKKPRN